MKYFLVILIFLPAFLSAQSSGKIVYTQTQKINFKPRPGMSKEMIERIPKERKMTREFVFNQSESIYKKGVIQLPENVQEQDERMIRRRRRMLKRAENGASYKNLSTGQIIDQREILGKQFLVTDQVKEYEWKITGNKKKILDYLVMEAKTTVEDTVNITAWFTPQIPIQNGPSRFGGLPGLILELEQNNGDNLVIATNIMLGELDSEEIIEEPKKGKSVTREEFKNIRKQKMKEQGNGRVPKGRSRARGN